jgi:hypothetical protein
VTDRIADQVKEWFQHRFNDHLVEFRLLSLNPYLDAFPAVALEPAHHKTHSFEDLTDRHHPDPHDSFT